jgi:hypothetical protein
MHVAAPCFWPGLAVNVQSLAPGRVLLLLAYSPYSRTIVSLLLTYSPNSWPSPPTHDQVPLTVASAPFSWQSIHLLAKYDLLVESVMPPWPSPSFS